MQLQHTEIKHSDFPLGKAYTPKERMELVSTFAFVRSSKGYDTLFQILSEVNEFGNREVDQVLLNLYDVFFLRASSDTIGKSHFLSTVRGSSWFIINNNEEIEYNFRKWLSQTVVIKEEKLNQILGSVWKSKHKYAISIWGQALTTVYAITFLIFLLSKMFGLKNIKSILWFDDMKR